MAPVSPDNLVGMVSVGKTRDHYVPQMYLRRFGRATSNGHQLMACTRDLAKSFKASVRDVAVQSGFYWGTDPDGVPHHHMEEFLTALEGDATTAFRSVLDAGKHPDDDALPAWPPRVEVRFTLAWWIAAQILRTVRQRNRLVMDSNRNGIDLPDKAAAANRHIRYIAQMIEPLAATVFSRPWGVGFSDYCLLTGDVPVVVLNGQDHDDQRAAVEYWDVYLPLDPHRCLYLPGAATQGDDKHLRSDHRLKLHPGLAMGLNSAMLDASVRHVFFHPDHDPTPRAKPAVDLDSNLPRFIMNYTVLAPDLGVQRRWLITHPAASDAELNDRLSLTNDEVTALAGEMLAELDRRGQQFQKVTER
jgi:hypothetical protein